MLCKQDEHGCYDGLEHREHPRGRKNQVQNRRTPQSVAQGRQELRDQQIPRTDEDLPVPTGSGTRRLCDMPYGVGCDHKLQDQWDRIALDEDRDAMAPRPDAEAGPAMERGRRTKGNTSAHTLSRPPLYLQTQEQPGMGPIQAAWRYPEKTLDTRTPEHIYRIQVHRGPPTWTEPV